MYSNCQFKEILRKTLENHFWKYSRSLKLHSTCKFPSSHINSPLKNRINQKDAWNSFCITQTFPSAVWHPSSLSCLHWNPSASLGQTKPTANSPGTWVRNNSEGKAARCRWPCVPQLNSIQAHCCKGSPLYTHTHRETWPQGYIFGWKNQTDLINYCSISQHALFLFFLMHPSSWDFQPAYEWC